MNDKLKVRITVYGSKYEIDEFPELAGFERERRTVTHEFETIEGKRVEAHVFEANYAPIQGGEFILKPFDIEINGNIVRSEAIRVLVEEDEEGYKNLTQNIDEAEFVVEFSKKEIFVGEGVKVRLSFYLSEKYTSDWQFTDDIGNQVDKLAKRIKPENSLESRRLISNITSRVQIVGKKKYFVYDIFEAVYYPLNQANISISALDLVMEQGKGKTVSLKSEAQSVRVKGLPPHPLKDKVAVGTFRLRESFSGKKEKETGESFDYKITLEGQANMQAVNLSKIESDRNLEFFETGAQVRQEGGKLAGTKVFSQKILPKIAGDYSLEKYFSFIYFDIKTAEYDTLFAKSKFSVTGNTIESKEDTKDIYSGIENLLTDKNPFNIKRFLKFFANFILLFMVMFLVYIWKKK